MQAQNPYAAPEAPVGFGYVPTGAAALDLEGILRAMDATLSQPGALDRETDLDGKSGYTPAIVCAVLGVLGVVGAIVSYAVDDTEIAPIITGGIFGGLFLFVGLVIALMMRRLKRRAQRTTAEITVRGYIGALAFARGDRACAAIAPPVREQPITTPTLSPVVTTPGSFNIQPDAMKLFAKTFAAQGTGQVRTINVGKVMVSAGSDRIAHVDADVTITSLPQWANLTMVISLVLVRLLGLIVALIMLATLRKTWKGRMRFRCVRALDGVWYLAEGWGDQVG